MHSKSFRSTVFLMTLCFSGVSFAASSAPNANPTTGAPVASKKVVALPKPTCHQTSVECTNILCSTATGQSHTDCVGQCLDAEKKCKNAIIDPFK